MGVTKKLDTTKRLNYNKEGIKKKKAQPSESLYYVYNEKISVFSSEHVGRVYLFGSNKKLFLKYKQPHSVPLVALRRSIQF